MGKPLSPDICVVGGGLGGRSLAAAAASAGVSVILVDAATTNGGSFDGLLRARALGAAAGQAQSMRTAEKFGIGAVEPEVDFRTVLQKVRDVEQALAPNQSDERLAALGVRIVKAPARFRNATALFAGDSEIRARHFVLATSSLPLVPSIRGLDEVEYLTCETVFDLTRRPSHLIVLGGGRFALELAQAFRRLGSEVTVVDAGPVLGTQDPEMVAVVTRRLRAEGVAILEHSKTSRLERRGKTGIRAQVETPDGQTTIDASHLLIAVGTAADHEGLDLGKAGIRIDGSGVVADAALRTTNRRIYSIGDGVSASPHQDADLVLRAILSPSSARQGNAIVPHAIFTDPQLAHVGLSEAEASMSMRGKIRVLRWPYAENRAAWAAHRTEGHIKLVADPRGEILGATIAGANAGEMIGTWALALSKGLSLDDMASALPPDPVMNEIGKRAAMSNAPALKQRGRLSRFWKMLR